MKDLNFVIGFASGAHSNHTDIAGNDYMDHVEAVVDGVDGDTAKRVAALHDVVEDTSITVGDIEARFGTDVAFNVALLTHDDSVDYMDYIKVIADSDVARRVKMSDLRNNMDVSRLDHVGPNDVARVGKYWKAYCYLASHN